MASIPTSSWLLSLLVLSRGGGAEHYAIFDQRAEARKNSPTLVKLEHGNCFYKHKITSRSAKASELPVAAKDGQRGSYIPRDDKGFKMRELLSAQECSKRLGGIEVKENSKADRPAGCYYSQTPGSSDKPTKAYFNSLATEVEAGIIEVASEKGKYTRRQFVQVCEQVLEGNGQEDGSASRSTEGNGQEDGSASRSTEGDGQEDGSASRSTEGDAAARMGTIFEGDADSLICGGSGIAGILRANPTPSGVRTTRWSDVIAIADAFLKNQSTKIENLELEVMRLLEDIALKEGEKKMKDMDPATIKKLVADAISVDDAFGSVSNAQVSKCGRAPMSVKAKLKPRPQAISSRTAVFYFGQMVKIELTGDIRVHAKDFQAACNELLKAEGEEASGTYCDEMCISMSELAVELSPAPTAGPAEDELREQLARTMKKLETVKRDAAECRAVKKNLADFMAQLTELQTEISTQHGKVMDAREALDEAEYEMCGVTDDLGAAEADLKKAGELLAGSGEKAKAAAEALEAAHRAEAGLTEQVANTQKEVEKAQAELDKVHKADTLAKELKGMVSKTTIGMAAYFKDAVLEPMEFMGITCDRDVKEPFPTVNTELPAVEYVKKAVANLVAYCADFAKPVFDKIKQVVDLSPLCDDTGLMEAIVGQLVAEAASATEGVVKVLLDVQTWTDPHKGQVKLTEKQVDELDGLREVMSVFGETSYYRGYLKRWKAGVKNSFLDIMKALSQAHADLKSQENNIVEALKGLKDKAQEAAKTREDANQKYAEAVEAKELAEGKEKAAQEEAEKLKADSDRLASNLNELEKALAMAEQRYDAAKQLLVESHKRGTNMLQVMEKLERLDGGEPENTGPAVVFRSLQELHAVLAVA